MKNEIAVETCKSCNPKPNLIHPTMSASELACTYASLILHDDGIAITAEKISTLVKAANVNVESYWPSLFAKLLEQKNVEDLIMNVGSGTFLMQIFILNEIVNFTLIIFNLFIFL